MKSTQVYQCIKIIALIVAMFGSAILQEAFAQKSKDEKQVSIRIIKEVDGKRNLIDTTLTFKHDEKVDVDAILKDLGVDEEMKDVDVRISRDSDFDFDFDIDFESESDYDIDFEEFFNQDKMDKMSEKISVEMEKIFEKEGELKEKLEEMKFKIKVDLDEADSNLRRIMRKYVVETDDDGNVFVYTDGGKSKIKKGCNKARVFIDSDCDSEDFSSNISVVELEDLPDLQEVEELEDLEDEFFFKSRKGRHSHIRSHRIMIRDMDSEDIDELKDAGVKLKRRSLEADNLHIHMSFGRGKFNLKFKLEDREKTEVVLYNEQGIEIYHEILNRFNGSYDKDIDLGNEDKGTLYLEIIQGNASVKKKISMR